MTNIRVIIVLLVGCILFMSGCQEQNRQLFSQKKLETPKDFADYIRLEPSVRDVQLWEDPNFPGLVIQTQHYQVHTTLLEPLMLRQIPSFLESVYLAYQKQLPRPLSSTNRFNIYLFGTRGEWEKFTRSFIGEDAELYLQIKKGAYTINGVWVGYNIGRKLTFQILGHEGWHQFNQHAFAYRLPSWLDEGIATLFETCRYTQGRFVFEPGKNLMRLGSLKETLQAGRLIPLQQLILLNPGQVISANGESEDAVIAFYAQNYALVRFLREYQYGIRLRQYHAMLLGAAEGTWPLSQDFTSMAADRSQRLTAGWNSRVSGALFDYYINEDIRTLDNEYREFCAKIVYHVHLKVK